MGCKECALSVHSEPSCIPGSGDLTSDIMIINSYASDSDEDNRQATPGKHLLEYLSKLGIDNYYYTNAIKCRTPQGTKHKVGEINKCKVHLVAEINKVKPKYVLLIGAQALKATVGGAITTLCGVVIEKDDIQYVPTLSPGIVFRDPGKAPFVNQAFNNFSNLIGGKINEPPKLNIQIIDTMAKAKKIFRKEYKAFSYDIESTGLNRFSEVITALGFGDDKVQYILPLEIKYSRTKGKPLAQKKIVRYVITQLNKKVAIKVAGNGKFDNLFLKYHYGVKPHLDFDVVLASHILNENTPNGVKENAIVECNALDWDINLEIKKGNVKNKKDYEDFLEYLGYDIYYEYMLYEVFSKKVQEDSSLVKLFEHVYMSVIRAYEEVEEHGVYIYQNQFQEVKAYLTKELEKIKEELNNILKNSISRKDYKSLVLEYQRNNKKLGVDINWASDTQIKGVLYKYLKLPVLDFTETGNPSVGESTLMQLRDKHEIIELILKYRGVAIQVSHFIEGWISRMQKGRLHPNFKLLTVTGRTSCNNPNLQQVPRDPRIRKLIGAPPGKSFIEADFSQAELRIATILSGDPEMKRIYQTGGDIHTNTYQVVSGKDLSSDKYEAKEQRKAAKATNFGFLYGMGWKKFKDYARDTYGIILTDQEAQDYRKKFFQVYSSLLEWHKRQRRIVKAMGQVRNPIGRIRRLPDINSSEQGKRAEAERQSINSPVQGFGSDLTLLGMAEVMQHSKYYHRKLRLDNSKFSCVGTVHDSTLFEVDDDYLEEFIPKVKQIMENPKTLSKVFNFISPIPIVVDVSVGKSWGAGIELNFENNIWRSQLKEYLSGQKS